MTFCFCFLKTLPLQFPGVLVNRGIDVFYSLNIKFKIYKSGKEDSFKETVIFSTILIF